MSVENTTAFTAELTANGVTTVFPWSFYAASADEIAVYRNGAVITTGFTVSRAADGTGSITFATAPTSGAKIRIVSDPDFTQEVEFQQFGPFRPNAINAPLDRAAARDIWLKAQAGRAIKVPLGETPPDLGSLADAEGKFLAVRDDQIVPVSVSDSTSGAFKANATALGVDPEADNLGAFTSDFVPDNASAKAAIQGLAESAEEALDGKGPVSTKSSATGATLYPVDHRLGRDIPPHPFEFIPANQHAGIIANTSTYDCAPDIQNMVDGWNLDDGKAGIIDFPVGRYAFGSKILVPNWLSLRGGTSRGHQLFLLPGHTGPYAFQFDSDPPQTNPSPSSQFQQRLIGFDINCNSAPNIASVVYAPSWNEKCGLSFCMMRNIPAKAFHAVEFHGGSAGFQLLDNCEFFFDTTATVGFDLVGKARSGALIGNKPIITINNTSVVGGAAPASDATSGFIMFNVDNVHLNLSGGIHLEKAWIGFSVSNGGTITGFGLTGSDDGGRIKELFARGSNHTGWIDVGGIENGTSSGTRVLRDFKTSINATLPDQGRIQVPTPAGVAWASGSFRTSGGAISGTPELVRCASVTRDATGYYKVTFTDTLADSDNYTVRALATDDTDCRAHVRDNERTGAQFFIRVYRISDSTLFDPDTVTFEVIRRPGL